MAVAAGDLASFELAERLAVWLLHQPTMALARAVLDLVRERSPFALVRAVELAESVLAVEGRTTSVASEGSAR